MILTKENEKLLIGYIERLDENNAIELADRLLSDGMEPLNLLELVRQGMDLVGRLYEKRDYFIADLIMAGIIYKQILGLDKIKDHFHTRHYPDRIGRVLLGTVEGDIHDIGKDIVRGMLEIEGFEVIDLGVDVPKEMFIKKYQENIPQIIGLSGILTITVSTMKEVVDAFKLVGIRDKVKVIVGGNHLTQNACKHIGADAFALDASVGVKICKEWINQAYGREEDDNIKSVLSKNS